MAAPPGPRGSHLALYREQAQNVSFLIFFFSCRRNVFSACRPRIFWKPSWGSGCGSAAWSRCDTSEDSSSKRIYLARSEWENGNRQLLHFPCRAWPFPTGIGRVASLVPGSGSRLPDCFRGGRFPEKQRDTRHPIKDGEVSFSGDGMTGDAADKIIGKSKERGVFTMAGGRESSGGCQETRSRFDVSGCLKALERQRGCFGKVKDLVFHGGFSADGTPSRLIRKSSASSLGGSATSRKFVP